MALGFVAGLVLGVGFAFLRERMDDRIHGRAQLEAAVGAPVLAVVPQVPGWRKRAQTKLVTSSASGSPAAEAYRSLRTNLQFISRDGSVRVISVTSPHAGEGKTTTVANLATTLALTGKRVMALSADLRRPRLHRFFGLDNERTLLGPRRSGAARRRRPASGGLDSLRIVTSGPVPPNPAELLSSDEMELVLRHLRSNADYVVIDTPPALVVSDAMIVAPRVDGVVVVVDADETTGGAASHAIDQLEQVGKRDRLGPEPLRPFEGTLLLVCGQVRLRLPLPLPAGRLRRGRRGLERQGPARCRPNPRQRLALAGASGV